MDGISIREFARREKCSHTYVQDAIADQHLRTLPSGKLDPALVGTGWMKRNRRAVGTGNSAGNSPGKVATEVASVTESDNPAAAAERILVASGAPWSQAEAERVKENYLALLRQLEYDQKARTVVMVADVAALVGQEYANVRTRLLAIPAEHAPQLARITSPAVMQDTLYKLVERVLVELTDRVANA